MTIENALLLNIKQLTIRYKGLKTMLEKWDKEEKNNAKVEKEL